MANTKKNAPKIDPKHAAAIENLTTTAAKIRYVHANITTSRGDISRILNIRYQWVRNVLEQKLKNA